MIDASSDGGERKPREKKQRPRNTSDSSRRSGRNRMDNRYFQPGPYWSEPIQDERAVLGLRTPKNNEQPSAIESGPPDAFALFCAYHLGITPDDGYQKPQVEEVARRYSLSVEELEHLLIQFGLDETTIKQSRFDLEGAQMDIRVAPAGISRTETARELFQDYLATR